MKCKFFSIDMNHIDMEAAVSASAAISMIFANLLHAAAAVQQRRDRGGPAQVVLDRLKAVSLRPQSAPQGAAGIAASGRSDWLAPPLLPLARSTCFWRAA
ncbi:hypothetical protein SAMN02927924_04463 [Sphingobium faniae]|nr:hypothetical protein SAMN02927924_04463 [Sphingobium faniae]